MSKIMTAPDFKFLCKKAGFEVGLDNHLHLQLGPAHLPHQGNHPERQRDVLGGAVPEHNEDKNTKSIRSARVPQYPHLMSSCSPSGGMKLMACSVSNLLSLTHLSVDLRIKNIFSLTNKRTRTGGTGSRQ